MTSFWGIFYGVVLLHFGTAIEFGGYTLYDPSNVTVEELFTTTIQAAHVRSLKETHITLPADSGKPEAFMIERLFHSGPIRIVRNHTKGSAHGVHLIYAKVDRQTRVETVYDVPEGKTKGTPIKCEKSDLMNLSPHIRCIAIATGWMIEKLPTELYVFQHVVHSEMQSFRINMTHFLFYILRETGTGAPKIKFDGDAKVNLWYDFGVEFGEGPHTLSSLSSNTTRYKQKFALIGQFEKMRKDVDTDVVQPAVRKMIYYDEFLLMKRAKNADKSKCMNAYAIVGTHRVTFAELTETIVFPRNMDEVWRSEDEDCFKDDSKEATVQRLTDARETPEFSKQIIKYQAAPRGSFYAVVLTYKPKFDVGKHEHYFATVNDMVFHLNDLRYAREIVYQLDVSQEVQYFRSTPAIEITLLEYDYAFKMFPYWMDQRMTYMEYAPLHNYYEAISHGGLPFAPNSIWAEIIITTEQCVNTSLLNVSVVGHHQEKQEINGTSATVERDMTETYEEFEDFHVDQRNPCDVISMLSQIKRTTRQVSKNDEIELKASDEEPIRVTLNLEEDEKFLLRFSIFEREESKCHDLDTVAIFLKDGMFLNEKAYIRTITYEALRTRTKTWFGTGKLTIAIPNGCFRVSLVSTYSVQKANNLRNIRQCLTVLGLTILMSGTVITLYYKFSLAGKEYRRLRRIYKRATRHDNFVRHYLQWKENIEEIIAQWDKSVDSY